MFNTPYSVPFSMQNNGTLYGHNNFYGKPNPNLLSYLHLQSDPQMFPCYQDHHDDTFTHNPSIVPDWLYQSIRKKFMNPDLVKKENINLMTVQMKPSPEKQIAAFVNIFYNQGVFVLYEKINDKYQEVYVKELPVVGIQAYNNPQIILTVVHGIGTGFVQSKHYVLRYTPEGYKEVWSGLAKHSEHVSETPNFDIYGCINFVDMNEFIYFKQTRKYESYQSPQPKIIESSYQIYKYNKQKMQYELV